jgi:hypothetical protein
MNTKEIWINTALEAQAQFMAKLEKDGLDISYFKEMYEKVKDNELCQHCSKSFTICGTKLCQKFREHEDGHIYLIFSDNAKAQGYKRIHNAANAFRILALKLNKFVKGITEKGEGVSSIFFTTNYSLLKHFEEMNKTIMTNIGKYPEYFVKSEGIRMYLITNTTLKDHADDDCLKEHKSLINMWMWLNRRDEAIIKPQSQTDKKVEIEVKVSVNKTDTSKKEVKKDRVEPVPTPTSSIIIDESSFKEVEPKKIVINSFDQLCPWAVCEVYDTPNPYEKGIYLYPKDINNVSDHKKLESFFKENHIDYDIYSPNVFSISLGKDPRWKRYRLREGQYYNVKVTLSDLPGYEKPLGCKLPFPSHVGIRRIVGIVITIEDC